MKTFSNIKQPFSPKIIFMIFFLIISNIVETKASSGWTCRSFIGNILLDFHTEGRWEEEANVELIRNFCNQLCDKLNYKETIYFDFSLCFDDCNPYYFLSYNRNENQDPNNNDKDTSYFFDSEKIIITASAEYFDPIKVLKLLEYGINNIKELIDNQIKFKYNFVYSNQYFWIQSLDSIKINKILSMENSEFINQLVNQQTKVIHYLLPNEYPDDKNIYYCYQNNKRYIYSKNRYYSNLPDTLLMILPNIKIFKIISCD